MASQEKQILNWMIRHRGGLTPMFALKMFGTFRLAARIKSLRDSGHRIETIMVDDGERRYARYYLHGRAA